MSTTSGPEDTAGDPVTGERVQLINLAYRLLGSLAEAEDVVQETYARWYAMAPERRDDIESPGAWLTTVASRICLDLLGSARARRERYVGTGYRSRCRSVRSGPAGAIPPTGSLWTSRSTWLSWSCWSR